MADLFPHARSPQRCLVSRVPSRNAGVPPALFLRSFHSPPKTTCHPERRVGRLFFSSRSAGDGRLAVEGSQLTEPHPAASRAGSYISTLAKNLGAFRARVACSNAYAILINVGS